MRNPQNNNPLHCNRSDFMKYAGLGVAAVSFGGMVPPSNAGAVSMAGVNTDEVDTDVLIVGGAATFAAVKAAAKGVNVTLVDKGYVGRSGLTPYFRRILHPQRPFQFPDNGGSR